MIKSFFDKGTEDIFNRKRSKEARRACPEQILRVAQRKLDQLNAVVSLGSLRIPRGTNWRVLKKNGLGSTAYELMTNSGFALFGQMKDRSESRLPIITD